MRDELAYSIRQIGDRVGRSNGYVENRLKLLDLAADLQQLVAGGLAEPSSATSTGRLEPLSADFAALP